MKNSEKMRYDMLQKPMGRLLFEKAYPTVIVQLISVIYNTADTYFVARINTQAAAAVGVVFSMMAIIQAVGFGIGMGSGSVISRSLGAKRNEVANKYGSTAVFMSIVFGVLLMILGLANIDGLMRLIGASKTVLPYATKYAKYILIAAPFMCMSFIFNNILKSEGQTFFSMIGMTTGGILNLILDPILIFGVHMGIRGAAIATMISQITSASIMGMYFIKKKSIVKISYKDISKEANTYLTILKTGIPTIFRQGLSSVAAAVLNVQVAVYGDAAVAAISISNKIYMLVRNVVLGIGQGYQPIAGYSYGAGKYDRVKKAFKLSCICGTVFCVFAALLIYIFRVPVITWFRADKDVIAVGSRALCWFCISMPLLSYSTFVNQTYQTLGFSAPATFLASCRQGIFFLPLAYVLPKLLQLTGIEMIQASADVMTFIVSIPFQIVFFRKHLSKVSES